MKVAIAAGGTGGHVFPGLAVAERLLEMGHDVVWLGTEQGFEARILKGRSIPARWLTIAGVRGKGALTLLQAPLRLLRPWLNAGSCCVKSNRTCCSGWAVLSRGRRGWRHGCVGSRW